jgi:S1-C subfamily serine protease
MTALTPFGGVDGRRPALGRIAAALALTAALVGACGSSAGSPASAASPAATQADQAALRSPEVRPSPHPAVVDPTSASAALALQSALVGVVQTVGPSVVVIETSQSLGSGIVFDSKGNIVTNAHVTEGNTQFTVTLSDGRQFDGKLVGSFPGGDLAVVHIDATGLSPANFGDSSKLVVGDIVLAVGNPLGLQSSVTEGLVSALGRTLSESSQVALPNLIQTSAPINPGNSGGALVNLAAEVVGIPTLAAQDPQMGGAAVGIGFAIPSNTVTDIVNQLIQHGHVVDTHRAYLGVETTDVSGVSGVLVRSVADGSPAAGAGIRRGNLIVSIDNQPTPSTEAFGQLLASLSPGQTVPVGIGHLDGSSSTVDVKLGELPG